LDTVFAWILSLIVSVAPVGRTQFHPEAKETEQETTDRYNDIAKDVVAVVYDPNEKPLFSGPNGREKTVDVMLAIATYESSFRKDVDFGLGKYGKGDGGRSWCMMQVMLGRAETNGKTRQRIFVRPDGWMGYSTDPAIGWGGEDLVRDRKNCFRASLAVLRTSFQACSRNAMKDKLSLYASGKCDSNGGPEASRIRMGLAMRWMDTKKPSFLDADVANWLNPTPPDGLAHPG
jgi:hypothetical protein